MGLKVLKNDKNIKKNNAGNYEFEHILVQEMGQSNVNALIDSNKTNKENATKFIEKYDEVLEQLKTNVKENLEKVKKENEDFLNGITEENKTKLALENFEKIIESKKKFIDEFDTELEKQYKEVIKFLEPQKLQSKKVIDDSDKTLELWGKFYKEEEKKSE